MRTKPKHTVRRHAQNQKQLEEQEQYNIAATVIFCDPPGKHCQEMNQREINQTEAKNPLRKAPYTHPNDTNLAIYPEKRDRAPRAEHYALDCFCPTPKTVARKKRGEYELRDLA